MFKKITLNLALISCVLLFITACDESTENKVNLTENDSKGNTIRIIEQQVAIIRVLNEDQNCSSSSAEAQFNKMRAVSLEGCPPRFTSAYLKHLAAWRRKARLEKEIESFIIRFNSDAKMIEVFFRGLVLDFGTITEMENEAKQLRNAELQISNEISTTYMECLSIAAEYDIDISKYK